MINSNIIPDEVYKQLAEEEGISEDYLKDLVSSGEGVILGNPNHKNVKPVAVGKGLRVKINANIGISPKTSDFNQKRWRRLGYARRLVFIA